MAAGRISLTKERDDTEAKDRIFPRIARVFHGSLTNQIAIRLLVIIYIVNKYIYYIYNKTYYTRKSGIWRVIS